jgi:hypothetical protein
MKKILFIFVLLTFLSAISGCKMVEEVVNKDKPVLAKVENVANFRFEDLPVPNNLLLQNEDSFVYETDNYRTGILRYRGSDNFKNIGNFYKAELPKYNWSLISSIEYKKVIQLIFQKPGWVTVLYIQQDGSSVNLTITIGPISNSSKIK